MPFKRWGCGGGLLHSWINIYCKFRKITILTVYSLDTTKKKKIHLCPWTHQKHEIVSFIQVLRNIWECVYIYICFIFLNLTRHQLQKDENLFCLQARTQAVSVVNSFKQEWIVYETQFPGWWLPILKISKNRYFFCFCFVYTKWNI